MNKVKHNCDNINCNHNDTKGLCCLFNPENCKYRQLQKENAELKNRDCWKSCEYANPKSELIAQHIKDVQNLTKAKELIKKIEKIFYSGENAIKRLSEISDILAEAEQFLNSEVEK